MARSPLSLTPQHILVFWIMCVFTSSTTTLTFCKYDLTSYFIKTIVLNRQGSPCYPHPTRIPARSLQTYLQTFISPSCLILSKKEEYYHRFFLSTWDRDPKQGHFYLRASFKFNYPLFIILSFLSLLTFYPSAINTLSVSQPTIKISRASLVAQWLRICLPMQGTRVRALVWEDPTCRGATRPVSHSY